MSAITYAVIDTTAIKHNLSVVARYAPNCKIMAVIKANAYGHGLITIAKALESVDAMAVARVDEGIQLRKAGISQRIAVLEGFICEQELKNFIQYDLEAVIHSQSQLEILENQQEIDKISIWLKLDVGMNRLGFDTKAFSSAYQRLWQCLSVNKPFGLMTHLSSADDANDEITLRQISSFKELVKTLDGEQSIANSAAILACPDSLTDWVRPGIMLYGVSPFTEARKSELKSVMSLHSRLIGIKHIKAGESVGYSGTWTSKESTKLGVVAIGYGDGYPRHARNGTPVVVNGTRVPLVGRVSMDMITIDLTELAEVEVGDPVTLWGQGLLVEEIARYADTIPYTLICGITQRVDIRII